MGFKVGDTVRVRDSTSAPWRSGQVTEMRGSQPVVKVTGQSRGFTWMHVEAEAPAGGGLLSPKMGNRVRVRDSDRDEWKTGTVTEMRGSQAVVRVDGQSRPFTWKQVETIDEQPPASPQSPQKVVLKVGDRARVRDAPGDEWQEGVVTRVKDGIPVVRVDGQSRGCTFNKVEPASQVSSPTIIMGGGPPAPSASSPTIILGAAGPAVPPAYETGDRVRVRDSDKHPFREGTVTEMKDGKPVVKVDGQSRGFTWREVESTRGSQEKAAPAASQFKTGDRVRVRDTERQSWKEGTVTEVKDGKPTVKVDGQSRGFTWRDVEPLGKAAESAKAAEAAQAKFSTGDRVRVRDSEKEDWKEGTVVDVRRRGDNEVPTVKVDGQSRGFTWQMVEHLGKAAAPAAAPEYTTGDRVRVRDTDRETWQEGTVTEARAGKQPTVKVDGQSRGFTWRQVEPLGKSAGASAQPQVQTGDRVRVRDSEKDDWKEGTVTAVEGGTPVVKVDGMTRGFTWKEFEPLGKAATPAAASQFTTGDRVRVRDTERQSWKEGTVTEVKDGKPTVKVDGQ
eukprot:Hpha_TRINITY_DN14856_c0_g2::TRINITY_DN14856_c0_g2_i4::g.170316::m.170316